MTSTSSLSWLAGVLGALQDEDGLHDRARWWASTAAWSDLPDLERGDGAFFEGSVKDHYRTTVSDLNEVIKAFQQYAEGDESWTRRFAWNKVQT